MTYQRTEYHREANRDDDRDQNKSGGWKSWFGLGDNKDREEDRDRGLNYQSTTTYRNDHPSSYGVSGQRTSYPDTQRSGYSGAVSTGYSGARGGYGYTTSDEVNRGPTSWNTDRDYNTRSSYGQPTSGDRDVYYKQETRTYGGDRDYSYRPTGDYTTRSYMPSRSYGFSGDQRDNYSTSRDYNSRPVTSSYQYSSDRDMHTPSRGYGFSGDRSGDYNVSRTYTTGGDRDMSYTSRNTYPESSSRTYGGDSSRGYTAGYTSGGYGGDSSYTRPSYQQSSYRY